MNNLTRVLLATALAFSMSACDDAETSSADAAMGGAGGAGGAVGGAGGGEGGAGGVGGTGGGEGGMGGEGGAGPSACDIAVEHLLVCGVDEAGCAGWTGDDAAPREDVGAGLLVGCEASPALAAVVNASEANCEDLLVQVSGLSADFAASCAGGGGEGGMGGEGGGGGLTAFTATELQGLFTDTCGGCHIGGGTSAGLALDDAHTATVGVASSTSALNLVEAGDHMLSYNWHKIAGSHLDNGGNGAQMPLGAAAWSAENISRYAMWIDAGAPND
jgi:hypothetical protein